MDVTSAFLNGTLEEEVFMQQPEGYKFKGETQLVCKLKQSLYGLSKGPDVGTLLFILA
uniref:Reverse transcriptase Ty1/copia-type domain-containing protein n=1 Tax=Amphimedon queenslandica TaxID=400682 RepID=A0A1X7VAH3_AMPQE